MNLSASYVDKKIWEKVQLEAHIDLFKDKYLEEFKNFDFTILISNENEESVCYSMVSEVDGDTAFLTFGGTFEKFRGKNLTTECLDKVSKCLLNKYKYIGFYCRSNNNPMIKIGLACGYKIIGMQHIYGIPNLEFLIERGN